MPTITEKLLSYKDKIAKAKNERAKLEGSMEELLKSLKTNFKVETIEEAEKLLAKLNSQSEKLEQELEAGMKKLEEDYAL